MNGIFLLTLLIVNATPSFEAQTLDGKTFVGTLTGLTPERLTLNAADGRVSLDTEELVSIATQNAPKSLRQGSGIVVTLIDGSSIIARQYTAKGRQAKITLLNGDVLNTPLSTIQMVQFQQESGSMTAEWSKLIERKIDSDLLVVRNGQSIDYHQGVLHDVTDDAVQFDLDGERLPIKRSKVFGFAYRHGQATELPPTICRIKDSTGSMWTVQSLRLAEKLEWTTPTSLHVKQPIDNIVQIDFSGGKIVYLSDLKPESIRWTPYFDVGKPPAAVEQFYAPRYDRGFESAPLQLGGVPYRKGLALHCRTEIVYRLPDRFRHFRAMAGIADTARPGGNVRLNIQADGRPLFDASITGDAAPQSLNLDLTDVRRLTITVDFGEHFTIGDYLLLCNARLTK
jgi:hypothetical protein